MLTIIYILLIIAGYITFTFFGHSGYEIIDITGFENIDIEMNDCKIYFYDVE